MELRKEKGIEIFGKSRLLNKEYCLHSEIANEIFNTLTIVGESVEVEIDNPQKVSVRLSRLAKRKKVFCFRQIEKGKKYRFWKVL